MARNLKSQVENVRNFVRDHDVKLLRIGGEAYKQDHKIITNQFREVASQVSDLGYKVTAYYSGSKLEGDEERLSYDLFIRKGKPSLGEKLLRVRASVNPWLGWVFEIRLKDYQLTEDQIREIEVYGNLAKGWRGK